MLYYPSHDTYYSPEQIPAHTEKISFPGPRGLTLSGLYLSPKKSKTLSRRPLIIQFHGNAQNLTSHFASLFWLVDYGYDYFIFDYEGYGSSPGKPSPHATVEDGFAALEWAQARFPKRPLVLVGQSLGGAVALKVAIEAMKTKKYPIRLVVISSSFDSYQAIARDVLSRSWLTWLFQPLAYLFVSDSEAPGDHIGEISPVPLVVIHGKNDPVVPYRFGERLFLRAKDPKEFWSYETPGHVIGFSADKGALREKLLKKLKEIEQARD
jgi:fermentation-respiration switch protein FrsA (DUF1100 family)